MQLTVLGRRYTPAPTVSGAAHALSQQTGLPLPVAHILICRGLDSAEEASRFLNSRLEHLPNPSVLKDLDSAATQLADALQANKKLAVFGDYDVDGMCATALLTRYFRALGVEPELYIPHRLTEGYGPTPAAMDELKKRGVDTVITVDTGTNAHEALAHAANIGLTVIVTDHHQPGEKLPMAAAILNPHRADDTSGLTMLCGSGVAFYLLMGLNRELRSRQYFTQHPEPRLGTLLDLAALGTIADVVPLVGPNRILVQRGLLQLGTFQNAGLKALANIAGLKIAPMKGGPDAINVAFTLAPRLNAAGRIDNASTALNLLLCDDPMQAATLADQLNSLNNQRRDEEKKVLEQALTQAQQQLNDTDPALVLAGSWHPGVVGIVASRIREKFNRVAFILGSDNGILKGSGRGVKGLDLGAAVRACSGVLLSGGGHAMAAGLSLAPENLPALRQKLNDALREQIKSNYSEDLPLSITLAPLVTPQLELPLTAASTQLTTTLQQLAPFGAGNDEPLLMLTGVQVTYAQPVGDGTHLKLRLGGGGNTLNAICFGHANSELGNLLKSAGGRTVTVFGTLKISAFNGQPDLQLTDALPLAG
ncbi:MAG TPA: single-stranded-DNA-specific exonuclease RecJ [Alphaproteobacteria bacterium]|nr:single-stranded-DNA-specific exonuclease RecJ [Alphaproteobacteria bacterium]